MLSNEIDSYFIIAHCTSLIQTSITLYQTYIVSFVSCYTLCLALIFAGGCIGYRRLYERTRSIQRTQTPPRLWPLTMHVVWPWPFVKVEKADVIRCRLLCCTLVPGMMSIGLILYEISPFVYFMWSLTFIVCQGHFHFNH